MASRRGRPKKDETDRKSVTLGIRVTPALRDRLKRVADESGRTVTEEIESRLRLSLDEPQQIQDLFGGPTNYWFLRCLNVGRKSIQEATGRKWWEDRNTYEVWLAFIIAALARVRPRGQKITQQSLNDARADGELLAVEIMLGLKAVLAREGEGEDAPPWMKNSAAFAMAGPLAPKINYLTPDESIEMMLRTGLIESRAKSTELRRASSIRKKGRTKK